MTRSRWKTRHLPREAEVLLWVAQGKGNYEIAEILGLSVATVKKHTIHIFEKLGVETRDRGVVAGDGGLGLNPDDFMGRRGNLIDCRRMVNRSLVQAPPSSTRDLAAGGAVRGVSGGRDECAPVGIRPGRVGGAARRRCLISYKSDAALEELLAGLAKQRCGVRLARRADLCPFPPGSQTRSGSLPCSTVETNRCP